MSSLLQESVPIFRVGPAIYPDKERVILRRLYPSSDASARRIINGIITLPDRVADQQLTQVLNSYSARHRRDVSKLCHNRYLEVLKAIASKSNNDHNTISDNVPLERQVLVGSYFMSEYSIECAALFNPSIVHHFDQSNLPRGTTRFLMSLRACGEGHISSITFRTGTVDRFGRILLDRPAKLATDASTDDGVHYTFPNEVTDISERVLFPYMPHQSHGMEDARFVQFTDDDGSKRYYASYTAYDGHKITPEMISTTDFKTLTFEPLSGDIYNKGMALFPRKVGGKYFMLSRQDDESVLLMASSSVLHWVNPVVVAGPRQPWELFKMGNCGSPIETPKGWLVLTHGVGSLRQYSIGAILLDLNDPFKIIGRLTDPIVVSAETEREGYVPNVVYTCGAMLHGDLLILPYAASDTYSSFAITRLSSIFEKMGF